MKNLIRENVKIFFLSFVLICFCVSLTAFSEQVKLSAITAAERCLNVIIPSLFAFMVISQIIISSGVYVYISKPFFLISKYLMAIPTDLFFVFLVSSIAGYPIGIKILSDMKKQNIISQRTANVMSVFCFCGGPAFYSGAVGLAVFGNIRVGLLIFVSIIISNAVVACLFCRILKLKSEKRQNKVNFSAELFTDAVTSTGKSLLVICLMIIFCSSVICILENLNLFVCIKKIFSLTENQVVLIKSCLELTYISELKGQPFDLLPYITAVCSFGGVCILIQCAALNKGGVNLKVFLAARPLCAVLSGVMCNLLKKYFIPDTVEVVSINKSVLVNFNNFVPSICLILMILLLNFKKSLVFSK